MAQTIRIGTRGSKLALWQADAVKAALAAAHDILEAAIEIVPIRTSGDRIRDRALADAGGKGLFTKEIEQALLDGSVDLAVHSAKDMETVLSPGLAVGACLRREDPRDALVSTKRLVFAALPAGARFGTASLRRQALLRRARADLQIGLLRGNVPTRVRAVEEGAFDATLLAAAGLNRLGLQAHIAELMPLETFPPACGQGIVAIECRSDDRRMRDLLAAVDHADSSAMLSCERAFLTSLEGSCRTPIAGHAQISRGALHFCGLVLSADGRRSYEARGAGPRAEAARIGMEAGADIKRKAPPSFLQALGIS
jgi:hydroxymethylbilane synthase